MLIQNQKTECLWCGKRLVDYDPEPWQTCVPRSEEHIIPKSIGGRIKTRDLCRPCNSEFGRICDHAFVKDKHIIEAAVQAGYKFADFHRSFRGTQKLESGGEVPTRYEKGEFKTKPQLSPSSSLLIPLEDWGRIRPRTRGSLIAKVRCKNLPDMDDTRIALEVDQLLAAVDADGSKEHFNETIGEGFRLTASSGPVTVPIEMFPWETHWCLAKIVIQLANLTWPPEYQMYYRPALQRFRGFLQEQEHDCGTKSGTGIFEYTDVLSEPKGEHVIECIVSPERLEWQFTFFGKARWLWQEDVRPIKAPPGEGWKVIVRNPLAGSDGSVECIRL